MSGLEENGNEPYTNDYYTSPQLFLTLYDRGINACGTCVSQQTVFSQRACSNGYFLAAVWMDRKYTYFVTTLHTAQLEDGGPTTVL